MLKTNRQKVNDQGNNFSILFTFHLSNPNLVKPISVRMNKPFYNDQAYIAEEFQLSDDYTMQTARLAFFKINSYKLSLIKASFCQSKNELTGILNDTLLNYTEPAIVLADIGFFKSEYDN
jgi:hypothetical protein